MHNSFYAINVKLTSKQHVPYYNVDNWKCKRIHNYKYHWNMNDLCKYRLYFIKNVSNFNLIYILWFLIDSVLTYIPEEIEIVSMKSTSQIHVEIVDYCGFSNLDPFCLRSVILLTSIYGLTIATVLQDIFLSSLLWSLTSFLLESNQTLALSHYCQSFWLYFIVI